MLVIDEIFFDVQVFCDSTKTVLAEIDSEADAAIAIEKSYQVGISADIMKVVEI